MAFVFVAKKFTGKLIDCNEGVLEWVNNSDMHNLQMWEGDNLFLPLLRKKGFFSIKITYDKNNIIAKEVFLYK
jgi:8-oxo-dGTP diphosphatase